MKLQKARLSSCLVLLLTFFVTRLAAESTKIEKLKSLSYHERATAQKALLKQAVGEEAISIDDLLAQFRVAADPEVKLRLRGVLKDVVLAKRHGLGAGFVGIRMRSRQIAPDDNGQRFAIQVMEVHDGTPALAAGLQINDLIIQVDEMVMREPTANDQFVDFITSKKPGDEVTMHVVRAGLDVMIKVTLGRFPQKMLDRAGRYNRFDDAESRFFDKWLSRKLQESAD